MSEKKQIAIAIASGKGGTGKTFVSTNIFQTLRNQGKQAILVDCDAEVPNDHTFFHFEKAHEQDVLEYRPVIDSERCTFCGKCVEFCEFKSIFYLPQLKQIKLLSNLCIGCGACSVACDEDAISDGVTKVGKVSVWRENGKVAFIEGRMNEGEMSSVPIIKETMKTAYNEDADYLIVDASPGASCPFIQTTTRVDFVLLVTEPTPFGLSDLKQAVDSLRILGKPFGVIINRAGLGNRDIYDYLEKEQIRLWAEIPFDREIARAYSEGKLMADTSTAGGRVFEKLVNDLTERVWK